MLERGRGRGSVEEDERMCHSDEDEGGEGISYSKEEG